MTKCLLVQFSTHGYCSIILLQLNVLLKCMSSLSDGRKKDRIFFEQLAKKIYFYGTLKFITVFTNIHQ